MNGPNVHLFLKNRHTFKYFSRMETWPIHTEKSMFNVHFTPTFYRNCLWAMFNIYYNQTIIDLDVAIWIWNNYLVWWGSESINP
jgi:hypothetical protein